MKLNLANLSQSDLSTVNDLACIRCDEIFDALAIKLSKYNRYYIGTCPIHNGDNETALNFYPDGYRIKGFWKCNTHQCHTYFVQNMIGFVRGTLSNVKHNWAKHKSKEKSYGFIDTIKFIYNIIEPDIESIDSGNVQFELSKRKFIKDSEIYVKQSLPQEQTILTKETIRNSLKIPAKYYIERGYSPEILNSYDVGLCDKPNRQFSNRIIVPIYGSDGNTVVAYTGRSVFEQCKLCKWHHDRKVKCPTNDKYAPLNHCKWRNSAHSDLGNYLYNFFFARKYIKDTGTILIVEGPGDIWRLIEAGFNNCVALLGARLTDQQEILLETSGATKLIVLTDNDEAGNKVAETIAERCKRSYNIARPIELFDVYHDTGEMPIKHLQEHERLLT